MSMMQILLVALVGASASVMLKKTSPEISMLIGVVTGVIILYFALELVNEVVTTMRYMASMYNINSEYISIVIKIVGITYLGEFAVSSLKDAGESGIASKVEIFAKLLIVTLSVPVISQLVSTVSAILL